MFFFFFSSRRRHTRLTCDWSSDVCSSDLLQGRQYRSLIRDARSDLLTKSFADRSEVLPARRPISLQQVEGNLGVENRLPDRLQGEQPTGLALEFLDSLPSRFGDRPKESNAQSLQSNRSQPEGERSGGNGSSRRNPEVRAVWLNFWTNWSAPKLIKLGKPGARGLVFC